MSSWYFFLIVVEYFYKKYEEELLIMIQIFIIYLKFYLSQLSKLEFGKFIFTKKYSQNLIDHLFPVSNSLPEAMKFWNENFVVSPGRSVNYLNG